MVLFLLHEYGGLKEKKELVALYVQAVKMDVLFN